LQLATTTLQQVQLVQLVETTTTTSTSVTKPNKKPTNQIKPPKKTNPINKNKQQQLQK